MKVLTVALLSSLAVSSAALAQTTSSPPSTTTAPPSASQSAPASGLQYYSHQPNEMRASKLIGTTVKNDKDESIGDINEVILDKDGRVAAVVVGVGGFLGMGEREVALDFKSLRLEPQSGMTGTSTVVKVGATKDQLKQAPAWTWAADKGGTTGQGTTPPARTTK